jgi:hypothetical protein
MRNKILVSIATALLLTANVFADDIKKNMVTEQSLFEQVLTYLPTKVTDIYNDVVTLSSEDDIKKINKELLVIQKRQRKFKSAMKTFPSVFEDIEKSSALLHDQADTCNAFQIKYLKQVDIGCRNADIYYGEGTSKANQVCQTYQERASNNFTTCMSRINIDVAKRNALAKKLLAIISDLKSYKAINELDSLKVKELRMSLQSVIAMQGIDKKTLRTLETYEKELS